MYKSSGTVWVLDMNDMQIVRQALTAAKAYAKVATHQEVKQHEQFHNEGVAFWFITEVENFEQKLEEG